MSTLSAVVISDAPEAITFALTGIKIYLSVAIF